jgi:hypothetical protein
MSELRTGGGSTQLGEARRYDRNAGRPLQIETLLSLGIEIADALDAHIRPGRSYLRRGHISMLGLQGRCLGPVVR